MYYEKMVEIEEQHLWTKIDTKKGHSLSSI